MKRHRRVLIVAAIGAAIIVVLFARPAVHLILAVMHDEAELPPPLPGFVDDASRLNRTRADVREIPGESDDPEGQLAELLADARARGLKVSVAGARHSMGGHTIYPGGIAINMLPWNDMQLSEDGAILMVQAGALWEDIIAYLDRHGRSVAVMQSNSSFSVGGSVSVNCHGWQYGSPPIASTVESFRIMRADGTAERCSRERNAELFSLALGGYGLFGVILDVELRVVPNEPYRLTQQLVEIDALVSTFDGRQEGQAELRSDRQMVYARMNIRPDKLFADVLVNTLTRAPEAELPLLADPSTSSFRRTVFRGSAESDYGKRLRWNAETKLQPLLEHEVASRNQLLNESVEVFQNRSPDTTDILHEYFIPRRHVSGFVDAMREIVTRHGGDLLNVTVRDVEEDTDTFLRYADERMMAFVMLFLQERTEAGEQAMATMTRRLIDAAVDHEGRYYLPYRLHATPGQFHRAYPQARRFFELKRAYDPDELFQNRFYLQYGMTDSDR